MSSIGLLATLYSGEVELMDYMVYALMLLIVIGTWREGIRFSQLPFVISFIVFTLFRWLTGFSLHWLLLTGTLFAVYSRIVFGEGDYSKFKPSGKFRVGYRDFKTKEFGNDCSVFYPAADDGSGHFGVPFLPYGANNIEGLLNVVTL